MVNKTRKAASLACGAAIVAFGTAGAAAAQQRTFDIPAESAIDSIPEFGRQAGVQITAPDDQLVGARTPAIKGQRDARQALKELLAGTGLHVISDDGAVIVLHRGGEAAGPPAEVGATAASTRVSELVVTGTQIRTADPITPVQTLTRTDIEENGYSRLDDLIEQLPGNFKAGASAESNVYTGIGENAGNNYSFASGVNLLGLGSNSTLVLLNGRRLPETSFGTSTDISKIPLSAIDHVDVLQDGASATYGADAVAGVVNIVTRTNYSGFETGARVTSIADGKAPNYGGYVLAGFTWDSGNFLIDYDVEKDNPLASSKRSFAAAQIGTDLFPKTDTNSVYAALRQTITSQLLFSADLFYSYRTWFNHGGEFGFPGDNSSGDGRQFGADAELRYAINDKWDVSLTGSYGKDNDSYNNINFAFVTNQQFVYKTATLEAHVDGELFDLPAGPVKIGVGGILRDEGFKTDSTFAFFPAPNVRREIRSAYGELLIPVVSSANAIPMVKDLKVDIAARSDNYSDFGSAFNPKYSIKWVPVDGLTVHASYGTSFRAPTLFNLHAMQNIGYIWSMPDPRYPSGSSDELIQINQGNPDLKAEHSRSLNLGFDYKSVLIPGAKISVSYFDILFKDKIESVGNLFNIYNPLPIASELGPFLNLNPTATQISQAIALDPTIEDLPNIYYGTPPYTQSQIKTILYAGYANAAIVHPRGLNASFNYQTKTHVGVFDFAASGLYFLSYDEQLTPTSPVFQGINTVGNPPRFRGNLQLSWNRGPWNAYSRVNYTNAYHDSGQYLTCPTGTSCTVSAYTTWDVGVSYSVPDTAPGFFRGVRLSFDIADVLDTKPPFVGGTVAGLPFQHYDGANASALDRALSFRLTKKW